MKKRIYFLDHLRIFTITMVIVYHVTLLYTNAFEFVQNPVPDGYDPLFMSMTFLISGPMLNSIMFFIAGYFVIGSYKKREVHSLQKIDLPGWESPIFSDSSF